MNVMLDYVSNFIASLKLNDDCESLAKILFKTEEECRSFYLGFLGRNSYTMDDLLDYRENRLALSESSIDLFLQKCKDGLNQSVLESTFLQSFSDDDLDLLSDAINNDKILLADIYYQFQSNVNKNIMKYVL
jgi:hypothetical protein